MEKIKGDGLTALMKDVYTVNGGEFGAKARSVTESAAGNKGKSASG